MYLIEPKRHGAWVYDPGISMALQEYVKDHIFLDDDELLPYMMHPVVQIGKFQDTYVEVNQPYMYANDIQIVRHVVGCGGIYLEYRTNSSCFLLVSFTDLYGN